MNTVEVRSPACVVSVTPTITSGVAYTAEDCVGDAFSLGNAVRTPGAADPNSSGTTSQGTAVLQSITIVESFPNTTAAAAALNIFLFSSEPTGSTLDNAATPVIVAADYSKLVGVVEFATGDYVAIGATAAVASKVVGLVLPAGADVVNLWAVAVCTGTPEFDGTTALTFKFGFLQN